MFLFFDLDGTLCKVDGSRKEILDDCLSDCCISEFGREEYLDAHQKALGQGKLRNRKPIFLEILKKKGLSDAEKKAGELCSLYRERVLSDLELYDDARILDEVDENLVLITNGPERTQRDKIEKLGLGDYFDEIIISGEVGFAKPNPIIFKIAHLRVGEKGPYIGNSPRHDVKGAKEAGFRSVLIDRGVEDDGDADFVIDSLFKLKKHFDI